MTIQGSGNVVILGQRCAQRSAFTSLIFEHTKNPYLSCFAINANIKVTCSPVAELT